MTDYKYQKLKEELRKLPRESVIAIAPLVVYCDQLRIEIDLLKERNRVKKMQDSRDYAKPPRESFEVTRQRWLDAYKKHPTDEIKLALKSMGVDV